MIPDQKLKETVASLVPGIRRDEIDLFFSGLDPDYFRANPPQRIALHLKLSARLDSRNLVKCHFEPLGRSAFCFTVTSYDYFSEFSLLCGLITSYGLNIESGSVFTIFQGPVEGGRNKIIDTFIVRPSRKARFGPAKQNRLRKEVEQIITLLELDNLQEARKEVNERVLSYLSERRSSSIGKIVPVSIRFGSSRKDRRTVMTIRSRNTPAFLYAFSNALSIQNIMIEKVVIETLGTRVHDTVFVSHVRGGAIKGKKERSMLRIATALTKQFTYFLGWAPNPARGIQLFDQLLQKILEGKNAATELAYLNRSGSLRLLARVLGSSEFLWEDFLQSRFDEIFPVLKNLEKTALRKQKSALARELDGELEKTDSWEKKKMRLKRFKDRELFRIDVKHLVEARGVTYAFSLAMTELAEVLLEKAWKIACAELARIYGNPLGKDGKPTPFAICGLGKFGGREMGYASDIELLLVFGEEGETGGSSPLSNQEFFERLGQNLIHLIQAKREGVFQLDLRLRPYGSKGSLANSLSGLESYYRENGGAAPFERQALTKLRTVAGDRRLGRKVERIRDRFTYAQSPWDFAGALDLRKRQVTELVKAGTVNVKFSPGGVIDLEYAVQYLQIVHGWNLSKLRTPSTLTAADRLCQTGLITPEERRMFRNSYIFLRTLIDALRVVRGNARDLVLPDRKSEEFRFLARRMGFGSMRREEGVTELVRSVRRAMSWSHRFFLRTVKKEERSFRRNGKVFQRSG
jgi:glutamate-ammonia-ligase adenylyltransferase